MCRGSARWQAGLESDQRSDRERESDKRDLVALLERPDDHGIGAVAGQTRREGHKQNDGEGTTATDRSTTTPLAAAGPAVLAMNEGQAR